MHSHSYLNTVQAIVSDYDGSIPFSAWLKQFFRAHKKFGSKDRKYITHASYCFYRLGNAFQDLNIEQRIVTGLFLCSESSNKILEEVKPAWNQIISLPPSEKINYLSAISEIQKLFPLPLDISSEIEFQKFNLSFLLQPNLYLRIRPGREKKVLAQLQNAGIDSGLLSDDCIELSNQSKIDQVLKIDEDVVIQDYNSQRTIDLFQNSRLKPQNRKLSAWDCCAASGGKSILLHDYFPNTELTVSDVRQSILINLQKRFKRAGVKNFDWFVADVASPRFSIQRKFDLIICDAPCSGSGTWSRTPEQLVFFKQDKINHYSNLQKKIVSNASKALKQNGSFLYITCSVFKKENEEVVEYITTKLPLQLQSMNYLKGYDKKADTLFAALFTSFFE